MTRPFEVDIDPVAVEADGIAESQSPSAGDLALDGVLVSGGEAVLDYARLLGIASDGNDSGNTFTVVGEDADGVAQTEVITGPNTTTVQSLKYYSKVTQITISGNAVGNLTVGTVDEIASKTIPLDWRSDDPAYLYMDVTGTIDFTVQETYDDLQNWDPKLGIQQRVDWIDITALADGTVDAAGVARVNATALRIQINSYSPTAEVQLKVGQSSFG